MKKFLAILMALVMTLALVACGGGSSSSGGSASTPSTSGSSAPAAPAAPDDTSAYDSLKAVELIGADSTGKGAAGQIFGEYVAQRVDELTGGKLTIDYHPNGDLGGDADLLRQTQSNDIQIVVCQTAPTVSFIPEMAVFDLPMSFAKYDGDTIDNVLNGDNDFTKALGSAYEAQNLHLLGFLQNATFRLTSSNKNLQSLSDFSGLQIRTMENANHMAFWQAIGAQPTPLAWAEVYVSLQNKMIDAEENAADTIVGANLNEVQKYLARSASARTPMMPSIPPIRPRSTRLSPTRSPICVRNSRPSTARTKRCFRRRAWRSSSIPLPSSMRFSVWLPSRRSNPTSTPLPTVSRAC